MPHDNDTINIHERLVRIETMLEAMIDNIKLQRESDEGQDKKLDKILENDKDKLQRIAVVEEKAKNVKTALWLFAVPIVGNAVRWFM